MAKATMWHNGCYPTRQIPLLQKWLDWPRLTYPRVTPPPLIPPWMCTSVLKGCCPLNQGVGCWDPPTNQPLDFKSSRQRHRQIWNLIPLLNCRFILMPENPTVGSPGTLQAFYEAVHFCEGKKIMNIIIYPAFSRLFLRVGVNIFTI